AIASSPQMLLLDEPTSNVDPEFQVDLYQILKELNKEITVVVVTHDIGVISSYVRSVACVNMTLTLHEEGKITEEMLKMAYPCPVDLIAHGIPHRVFHKH
ncbi:MAG: AAA family ATPase, partial [Desulfatiglandales bacterium]